MYNCSRSVLANCLLKLANSVNEDRRTGDSSFTDHAQDGKRNARTVLLRRCSHNRFPGWIHNPQSIQFDPSVRPEPSSAGCHSG